MINFRTSRAASKTAVYMAAIILAFSFAYLRLRSRAAASQSTAAESADVKPFFSLTTNRTYATNERARLWVSYQGVDALDFRVYRVSDPVKFFKQLDDPHQFGDREKTEVAGKYTYGISVLEGLRWLKNYLYQSFKGYAREQLNRDVRQQVNQRFHSDEERRQTPLNFSDYARVPLLNPNQLVSSWRERLAPLDNEYDQRTVSLGKREPGVYLVEAVHNDLRAYAIAIVSDMIMVTKTSRQGDVMVYAADRKTGAPRANASVEVIRGQETLASGSTNDEGIVQTKVTPPPRPHSDEEQAEENESGAERPKGTTYLITASAHDQFAISDLDSFYFNDYDSDPDLNGYIYTDRPVYRPSQKVYFKGIMRHWGSAGWEMVEGNKVKVTIEDPDNGKIFERELQLSSRGTFNGEVDIPDEAPLGNYTITASLGDSSASSYFNVEEYKKPEYKVKVTGPKQFASVGERVKFSIDAKYFFGAPVAGADVQYYIYRSRYYRWWWDTEDNGEDVDEGTGNLNEGDDEAEDYGGDSNDMADQGEGQLDSSGHMTVTFEVPQPEEGDEWDYTYRLEAHVTDSSRREMQASAEFVGTRGKTIAEAQPDQYLYFQGDTAKIKVRAGDYEGKPVSASVTLKFIKQEWAKVERDDGNGGKYTDYELHESELSSADVKTNDQGEAVYEYPLNALGDIYVKAIIHEGRKEIASRGGSFWVADRTNQWEDFSYRNYDEHSIKLIPDRKSYAPGDTAHVLVMLPEENVHLLVTTELASVLTAREINAAGRTLVVDVPIERRFEPNVYMSVAYVRDNEMYSEDHAISVPARERMLDLQIIPNKTEYKPRETASYTILARNADGSPAANTEVSLGVVDEAIYSIEPESAGNIRHEFYGQRYNEVQTNLSTEFTFTGYAGDRPAELARNRASNQLADFKNSESESSEPTIRRDFRDTAFWQPDVVTGADGRAVVDVKLPDNLTTWRATARAVTDDTRVGSAVQKVLARKDLILRLETPRFFTEGDTVTISAVVHNFLNSSKVAHVSLEVTGAELLSPAEETQTIATQGQHRFDWRISAKQAGQVRLLAKALTDSESDAVELTLDALPHGLRQTMGGSTTITNDNAEQTISLDLPAHPDQQARKLRIEAAPSIASTLFGALDYLTGYPYGCTEQTMSQFLPDVIVAQTLQQVQTARIRENNKLDQKVQRGLDRLYSYQHADGGWGWWKNDQTDAFMTAYVVDGLAQAKHAGYEIEDERLDRAREKLKAMLEANHAEDNNSFDADDRAYMIYALEESGGADSAFIDDAYNNRAQLQPFGRALLALAMKQHGSWHTSDVAAEIESSARANDFDAHWESFQKSHWSDYKYSTDVEATALSLKALAQINPQSPLLAKAARWLVSNRRNGYYWDTTKQTAFAIYGLTEYLKISNELAPDYDLEVYVNDERVISRHVSADDVTNAQSFVVERRDVSDSNRIRVVKKGRGVLYLSTSLEYFTGEDEVQAQGSRDLRITREYMRLRVEEHEDGQASWKIEPLAGELRSGDLIVSRIHIEGAHAQYVMIEDPIPAGCEQVAYVSGINLNYTEKNWTDWYSAREFRDNRTVIFLDRFDGSATFQYAMRVEIPGEFRVAPARVEQMYQPSVQANTANSRLSILDRR